MSLTEIFGKTIAAKVLKNPYYVPKFIGCSSLGMCPRKVVMMFDKNIERREYSEEKILGEQRQFRTSKRIEQDYANVYMKKGIMFAYNAWITEWLPKGCAGQFDFLLRRDGLWELIEFKAPHPNVINFSDSLPKPYHIMQAEAYVYALHEMGIECDRYCVMNVPSGGTAMPVECWRDVKDIEALCKRSKNEFFKLLKAKKIYRETGELPPIIERELALNKAPKPKKETKIKIVKEVKLVSGWQCNEDYCPFSGVSCEPDTGTNKVASILYDGTIEIRKGYEEMEDKIKEFVSSETK